jgi:YaaC-like protein
MVRPCTLRMTAEALGFHLDTTMKVAQSANSQRLSVNGRVLPFSYFPVGRGGRRKAVYDSLFATSPWAVMSGRITEELGHSAELEAEALAFLEQARQFYDAAGAYRAANPLLYYYAFLNLAKPLIRVRGFDGDLARTFHGLQNLHSGKGDAPTDFEVIVEGKKYKRVGVFAELSRRLGTGTPATGPRKVEDLMAQIVVGHRLWRQATGARERFIGIEKIEMRQDVENSRMWLRLLIYREDFDRFDFTHKFVRESGGLGSEFHEVKGGDVPSDCVAFEQLQKIDYGQRPSDHLDALVDGLRDRLWRIVSTDAEQAYRRYYLHLPDDPKTVLPQLSAIWALLYHYGSLVRYQPHRYAAMTRGKYGAFIQEFVAAQPEQLLYLLASELCQREVTKPAIA